MTLEQTRQLGIEFERRIQVMDSDMEFRQKLDTETIYSFLNQYQDKFIHDIYRQLDSVQSSSKISAYVETILQGLLAYRSSSVTPDNDNVFYVNLPSDFGLYLSSTTRVSRSYSMKNTTQTEGASGIVPNILVSQSDAEGLITRPQDSMRIMRQPVACLSNNRTIKVLCDKYTTPITFGLSYYKIPKYMDLMTSSPCELPMDAFEDLVSGAIDLYVQYAAGAEARKRQMEEQQERLNKQQQ